MSANMADRMETLERAKSDLLDRAADGLDGDVVALLRRYYRHVAGEDVLGRKPEDLLAAALEHRKLAAHRPQGTVTVRVTTPPDETDSRTLPPPSVVEIVCDDMPFIVDSVTAELSRRGRAIHLVIHPLVVVRRDVMGELLEVCDASTAERAGEGALVESWMRVEVDRVPDETALDQWEGTDIGLYEKIRVRVATLDGEVAAWLYVLDAYEGGLPAARYLGIIADAAEVAGAPDDYVADIRHRPCRSSGL